MPLVISDTSPVRYVQIDQIDLLSHLFGKIMLPSMAAHELSHRSAPPTVQNWMREPPGWVEVLQSVHINTAGLETLDPGERSVIALALAVNTDLILLDDRKGTTVARSKGIE